MRKENDDLEEMEDVTKYGEFVSSYFAWLTLDGQKARSNKLEEITKNKKKK